MTKVESCQLPDEPIAPKKTTPKIKLDKAELRNKPEPKTKAGTTKCYPRSPTSSS